VKEFVLQVSTGRRRGVAAALTKPALSALSLLYRFGHNLHRWMYRIGLFQSVRLPVPVVSVGNVTTGGTGKTPFVEFLGRWFEEHGLRAAILSRGYGRVAGTIIDDEPLSTPSQNLLRLAGANRVRLARQALETFKPDVILLDDGFQHYRIRRDLDIVLVDAVNPFSNGRILPRGLLRERPVALKRAGVVVITRSDQVDPTRLETIRSMLERLTGGAAPIVEASHKPIDLDAPPESRRYPLEWLRTRELVAFSGIGNPDSFRLTLESLGANVASHVAFPDHHSYTRAEIRSLNLRVKEFMAEGLVTTQKDAVKLPMDAFEVPLLVLKVEMRVGRGRERLEEKLAEAAGLARAPAESSVSGSER
jgi:tetraacyldisaccharide 4'-kinase